MLLNRRGEVLVAYRNDVAGDAWLRNRVGPVSNLAGYGEEQ
jgi:hypothetical protein